MKNGLINLTVAEGKRLIAKAVAHLPQVKRAMGEGTVILAGGTTNGYLAEELSGIKLDKLRYTAGIIAQGRLCVTDERSRLAPKVFQDGRLSEVPWTEALDNLRRGDLFVKGANALDHQGNVGILLGSPSGGTIGRAIGFLAARGIELIVPVGLEKLIPSVSDAVQVLGISRIDSSWGLPCGMQMISGATLITEDKALSLLSGCSVWAVAAGGIGDHLGSVTLAFSGDEACFARAEALLGIIMGEPALSGRARPCPCPVLCQKGRTLTTR